MLLEAIMAKEVRKIKSIKGLKEAKGVAKRGISSSAKTIKSFQKKMKNK